MSTRGHDPDLRVLSVLDKLDVRLWHVFTSGLAVFFVATGLNYGLGGDQSASRALDSVRAIMSISQFGVINLIVGILVFAAMSTRWIVVAMWLAFCWSLFVAILVLLGALAAGQGGWGVVVWGLAVGPASTVLMLSSPDKSLLYTVAGRLDRVTSRRRERRGGAA